MRQDEIADRAFKDALWKTMRPRESAADIECCRRALKKPIYSTLLWRAAAYALRMRSRTALEPLCPEISRSSVNDRR